MTHASIPRSVAHATPDLLPGRVLLVEDDSLQARMMSAAIESLGPGWMVEHVATAEACLEALQVRTFSAVIIDHILPGISGLELLREVRDRGWTLATILVTAHGSEELAAESIRLGVSEYVKKQEGYLTRGLPGAVQRIVTQHRRYLQKMSSLSRMRVELAQKTHQGLLDSFATPIVHDIKNPLFVISGIAEITMSRLDDRDEVSKGLLRIQEKVGWISKMVDRLLLFARQQNEERLRLDLGEFLEELVAQELEPLQMQNVRLVYEGGPDRLPVRAGPHSLEQVFLNLIANATEAMMSSQGGGLIRIRTERRQRTAVVFVEDTGPGIPREILPRLFQPFTTHGKGPRGTGLGLPIAAGVLKEHGGSIRVWSETGHGTRFAVSLPLESEGPVALVLEDERAIQVLLTGQLADLGIRADIHADGREVLARMDEARWDIVILDIRTPNVSGMEVYRALLDRRPELVSRAMILSGCIEDRSLLELLGERPVPCLPKPYTTEDFNGIIRLLLRGAAGEGQPGSRDGPE